MFHLALIIHHLFQATADCEILVNSITSKQKLHTNLRNYSVFVFQDWANCFLFERDQYGFWWSINFDASMYFTLIKTKILINYIFNQIESMMLHVTKHPIVFHTKGLFNVSNETLLKVRKKVSDICSTLNLLHYLQLIGAISAYSIFFIQFMKMYWTRIIYAISLESLLFHQIHVRFNSIEKRE